MKRTSFWGQTALQVILAAMILLAFNLQAQRTGSNDSSRNRLVSSFNQSAPGVGEKLPQLEAFDANGKPWNTDQIKGKYTVLVFGCLT